MATEEMEDGRNHTGSDEAIQRAVLAEGRKGGDGIPRAEVLGSIAEPRPQWTCLQEAGAKEGKELL